MGPVRSGQVEAGCLSGIAGLSGKKSPHNSTIRPKVPRTAHSARYLLSSKSEQLLNVIQLFSQSTVEEYISTGTTRDLQTTISDLAKSVLPLIKEE